MPGSEVRLRRSLGARMAGGWILQGLVSFLVVFDVVIVTIAGSFAGSGILVAALPSLIVVVPWLVGMTAGARADGDSVSWRYFVRRRHAWSDVQVVELGRYGARRLRLGAPAVFVTADGRRRVISPALDVGDRRLTQFATGLTVLARAAGVSVEVDPADVYWRELLAGDLLR